jgi:hypothetical protein
MPSPGHIKRVSRIKRRASAEVREAYESGQISARMADTMLYLPADRQRVELQRRLSEAKAREHKNQLAAETIRGYLDTLNGRPVDLHQLSNNLRASLLS